MNLRFGNQKDLKKNFSTNMTKEIIILELNKGNKSQLVQDFLKQKSIDYRLLSETQPEANKDKEALKKRLVAAYQRQAKNKNLQKELSL
jgi:hypothetical protein